MTAPPEPVGLMVSVSRNRHAGKSPDWWYHITASYNP
jgi:hypothetical protein